MLVRDDVQIPRLMSLAGGGKKKAAGPRALTGGNKQNETVRSPFRTSLPFTLSPLLDKS